MLETAVVVLKKNRVHFVMVTHMINIFALFPFSLLFYFFLFFFFFSWLPIAQICIIYYKHGGDRRGRDRMVDGFRTTCAISAYHHTDQKK